MEAFLLALFGHEVRYMYPRLWHTKAETLAAFIAAYGNGDSWTRTAGRGHVRAGRGNGRYLCPDSCVSAASVPPACSGA